MSLVRGFIFESHRKGHIFGTCVPVLCELEVGIQQRTDVEAARRRLILLRRKVRVCPLEDEIAELYARTRLELRRAGRVLSQVDIMLASLAREMRLTLLTSDRDFEALPDIHTENWIPEPP